MNKTRNTACGILLIVLAVCLILWKLNVFNLPASFAGVATWGLIVSAIMVIIIIHSILDLHFGGIFIPLAVICIIFDKPLGITAITPWVVLIAAVLLTIAFDMLFSKHWRYHRHHRNRDRGDFTTESFSDDENGNISHAMRFGSATKYVRGKNLKSADLTCNFGELSVFFDGAEVPDGEVNLDCRLSFGEMDIYLPKEWYVDNRVSVALGNCDDRCMGTNPAEHDVICRINGSVSFGELKLIRV